MNKSRLRNKILNLRKKNLYKKLSIYPERIFKFLKKKNIIFKNVGGYYSCNFEIDNINILNFLRNKKVNIFLPIIRENNEMDFFEWKKNNPLKINKYGIVEPISFKKIYPDIIFVPLVAFDKKLNRLGYGGGFYDRYIQKSMKIKNIVKIGLAFSYQELKAIPIDKFDKKLDFIVTEKEIIQ